jgi:hypothetical protein
MSLGDMSNLTDGASISVQMITIGIGVIMTGVFAVAVSFKFVKGGIRTAVGVITALVH